MLLLGPSGCGKSSLALCLAGLYPHAIDSEVRGRVLVYGKPVAEQAAGDAPWAAGIVFQDFESQFCLLRVEEEIAFCLGEPRLPAGGDGQAHQRGVGRGGPQRLAQGADSRAVRRHEAAAGARLRDRDGDAPARARRADVES